jgi:hypothetical protein
LEGTIMTDTIPSDAQAQLRHAVDTALASPATAQGFLSNVPDLSKLGDVKTKTLEVIDGVLAAIDTIQKYAWLIPAKYHDPIQKLEDALTKVRGWID